MSRVLNGQDYVSEDAYAAVTAAIERLGYVPNRIARGLRSGRTHSIGLSLPDLRNPVFTDFVRAFRAELGIRRYALLLSDAMLDVDVERQGIQELASRRVDAIVAVHPQDVDYLERVAGNGTPVFGVVRWPSAETAFHAIRISEDEARENLMSRLSSLGHERVHYVTLAHLVTDRDRRTRTNLFALSAEAHGLELVEVVVDADRGREYDQQEHTLAPLSDELLAAGPTCLLVAQPLVVGALTQLQQLGLEVPADLSVVAIGRVDWAAIHSPPLDTFEVDYVSVGRLAAQSVMAELTRRPAPMTEVHVADYVARASSAPTRVVGTLPEAG